MDEQNQQQVMLLGVKESFLIMSLEKKLEETGFPCFFQTMSVDGINQGIENADLVVYYMETNETLKPDVLHYMDERLIETNKRLILIGERDDTDEVTNQLHGDMICKVFPRPLDTEAFLTLVKDELTAESLERRKKKILIVDDDPTYIGVIRDWLRGKYRVSMANSGLRALTWLANNPVDLVLLDHEMPVTSGPKVLEMMRSEESTRNIPVIFLTGKSDRTSVMQAVTQKPEGYLLKTISREKLLEELDMFFRKQSGEI